MTKKYIPDRETIQNHKHLRVLNRFFHDPNIWHMNRRSVSGAFATGLFWAMIPIPLQMLTAAFTAIVLRINLPISLGLVWLTNPITMPPIFYINYHFGSWLLNTPDTEIQFELSMQWISDSMSQIWQPLYVGSLAMGLLLAMSGYIIVRIAWRLRIVTRYKERRLRKRLLKGKQAK